MRLSDLKKPNIFQKGNMTLYSNEYIAKNVIQKHLDPTINSGTKRIEVVKESIEWICKTTANNGSILDVGCGPGIYSKELSLKGYEVTGIDISCYNIEFAIRHFQNESNPVVYICADITAIELKKKYDTILVLYALYSFFNRSERLCILRKLYMALKDDGKLIIEVFRPEHYKEREESTDWEYITSGGFWKQGEYLELNAFYRYDEQNTVLIQAAAIDNNIAVWNSWIKMFDFESLCNEITSIGIEKVKFYDDARGSLYTGNCDTICAVIEK